MQVVLLVAGLLLGSGDAASLGVVEFRGGVAPVEFEIGHDRRGVGQELTRRGRGRRRRGFLTQLALG